jgi:NAD/NADP transhydrogenase beta subunit
MAAPRDPQVSAPVAQALRLGRLLDTSFRIPGTRIRFGIDPILGLVPGLGDAIAALIGGHIVLTALRAGAPRWIIGRMLANIALDAIVGAVPIAGTIFDVAFKAHRRNARMLADWSVQPGRVETRQRRLLIGGVGLFAALLAIAVVSMAFGVWAMIRMLAGG